MNKSVQQIKLAKLIKYDLICATVQMEYSWEKIDYSKIVSYFWTENWMGN